MRHRNLHWREKLLWFSMHAIPLDVWCKSSFEVRCNRFYSRKESKKLISLIEDFKFLFEGVRMQHFSYRE